MPLLLPSVLVPLACWPGFPAASLSVIPMLSLVRIPFLCFVFVFEGLGSGDRGKGAFAPSLAFALVWTLSVQGRSRREQMGWERGHGEREARGIKGRLCIGSCNEAFFIPFLKGGSLSLSPFLPEVGRHVRVGIHST